MSGIPARPARPPPMKAIRPRRAGETGGTRHQPPSLARMNAPHEYSHERGQSIPGGPPRAQPAAASARAPIGPGESARTLCIAGPIASARTMRNRWPDGRARHAGLDDRSPAPAASTGRRPAKLPRSRRPPPAKRAADAGCADELGHPQRGRRGGCVARRRQPPRRTGAVRRRSVGRRYAGSSPERRGRARRACR
jgi:hypothetical protein